MHWLSKTQAVLCGLLLGSVPMAAQAVEIRDAYVRGMPPGQANTAAFLSIENNGQEDWVLVAACTDAADSVELHRHEMQGGMMAMRQVEEVRVPAGGSFRFQPGDHHIMLIGLKQALREGDSLELSLCDADKDCVTAILPVRSILNEPSHQHH